MMKYREKLQHAVNKYRSCLCIGLDPHLNLFPHHLTEEYPDPDERVVHFLTAVIEITHPYCAAYKPNLAFFEALGSRGFEVFQKVVQSIPEDKIIIADAKRGDINSTAHHYRKIFFDTYHVDAITLNPLMGFETLSPYFGYPGKGLYVLTLTSNAGATDFLAKPFSGFDSMAGYIAANLQKLQRQSEAALGMVVGATKTIDLAPVLHRHPSAPLLIPGIGKQGGNIEELVSVLKEHEGIPLISSSRSILFSGVDDKQWKQATEEKAKLYREKLMPISIHYA